MPTVAAGGREVCYQAAVPAIPRPFAPPVVPVHGAGGSGDKWQGQLEALAAGGYRAMAIDLPGHGGSGGEGLRRIDGYRDVVLDFVDELRLDPLVLVGHSMGGAIAQAFALAYPDRLVGLALVGTGAKLRVHPDILTAHARGEVSPDFVAAGFRAHPEPELIRREAEVLRRTPADVRYGDFLACDAFNAVELVGEIRVPTLVLVGREDRMTPVKYSQFLAERIADSRLVIVEGAGHYVMLEQPAEVNRALLDFLADLGKAT